MKIDKLALMLVTTLVSSATAAVVSAQTVFIPEGSANSVLAVSAEGGKSIRRIEGLDSVHGLSGANEKGILVVGSLSEVEGIGQDDIKPENISAEDHEAHHGSSSGQKSSRQGPTSILSIVRSDTGDVVRTIAVPGAVHHTAVSSDERFAVATHPSEGGISIVDLASFKLESFVPTGSSPNYAVLGATANLVYVSNAGNGTISEVDLDKGIVLRNFPVNHVPEHMVMNAQDNILYAADSDAGLVVELDIATGNTLRSFKLDGEIHGLDLASDGDRLLVSGTGTDKLNSIDLNTGEVVHVPLSPSPYHLTAVQGTNRVFVSSRAEPIVWILDADSLKVEKAIEIRGEGHQMTVMR